MSPLRRFFILMRLRPSYCSNVAIVEHRWKPLIHVVICGNLPLARTFAVFQSSIFAVFKRLGLKIKLGGFVMRFCSIRRNLATATKLVALTFFLSGAPASSASNWADSFSSFRVPIRLPWT